MLSIYEIADILKDVEYLDWGFRLGFFNEKNEDDGKSNIFLQVKFRDTDFKEWTGRKWHVSRFATKDEIVQTALKAVLTAVEHEAREAFLYKGFPIFGPHHSLDDLVGIQQSKREEALK